MGNDQSVMRKIRAGQLQGGAVTIGALAGVDKDIEIYGLPFLFHDLREVDQVRARMDATLLQGLEKKGFIAGPLHFDFVIGAPGSMPGTVKNLLFLSESVPAGSTWSVAGIGKAELPLSAAAIAMGGHVRVGLEDNLYVAPGQLARSNGELVARAAELVRLVGGEVASVGEAREMLRLPLG